VESEILADLGHQHSRDREINAAAEFITRVKQEVAEYDLQTRTKLIEPLDVRIIYKDRDHWRSTF
jgi:hypothetical protein